MSLFGSMLEKLGLRKKSTASQQPSQPGARAPSHTAAQTGPSQAPSQFSPQPSRAPASGASAPAAKPGAMSDVDVVAKLEGLAKANTQQLNWRTSIVDLMKLLNMDSSLPERKKLATELGCPPELMNDSARMNVWLHKEVLRQIAQNGGNVPAELLD